MINGAVRPIAAVTVHILSAAAAHPHESRSHFIACLQPLRAQMQSSCKRMEIYISLLSVYGQRGIFALSFSLVNLDNKSVCEGILNNILFI
jgi:hypothetical protein